jgi:hypothetical protein
MSSLRLAIGIIWVTLLCVTHAIWTATALPVDDAGVVFDPDDVTRSSAELDGGAPAAPARRVDIYGNEVEAAITDYRIDIRGDIYERHAPQTALPEPARAGT